jgi:hypothetical protein
MCDVQSCFMACGVCVLVRECMYVCVLRGEFACDCECECV